YHRHLIVGQQLRHEANVEFGVQYDVADLVGIANRVGPAVRELRFGGSRHGFFPGDARGCVSLGDSAGGLGAAFLGSIATWLAIRMNLTADHALHATDLVFVHADDRVCCVGLAPWGRAVRLDLSADLVRFFVEDRVHPSLSRWGRPLLTR